MSNFSSVSVPLISVIMSVYNDEKYIHDSINSIINQSYSNIEFLIIDDNSSDNSAGIISDYSKKDSRILYFKNEHNKGLTENLNYLISKCSGKYIARMDADDISSNNRLKIQTSYLESHPNIDVLGGAVQEFDDFNNLFSIRTYPTNPSDVKKQIAISSPLCHPTVVFRKRIFDNGIRYNKKYKTTQDLDLWFKLITLGYKIANISDVVLKFRLNNDIANRRSNKKSTNEFVIYFNGIYNLYGLNYRLIYPLIRLIFRFLPKALIGRIYKGSIREILNS